MSLTAVEESNSVRAEFDGGHSDDCSPHHKLAVSPGWGEERVDSLPARNPEYPKRSTALASLNL